MAIKRIINNIEIRRSMRFISNEEGSACKRQMYNIFNRFQWSKADDDYRSDKKDRELESANRYCSSSDDELSTTSYRDKNKWKPEIAWFAKALEPALQLYKWALPLADGKENKPPPTNRSVSEIFSSIQKSKLGVQDWSLSDLTIGMYLLYLRQASTRPADDVKGEVISSESLVQDFIYNVELAKGCYRDTVAGLARNSMLRESNVVKFVKSSSVLRPGYYIGIDPRKKLVILGIRGTHTLYDLITDIITSGHEEITFEGYSTHFGTAEAARWFLTHEIDSIRKCLEKHKGFRLRLVGHSLGGAIASLLAIMLRKKSFKELGFSPDIITAVGYATPPCVSQELAENCSEFVTSVVMQDDVIPRLSIASLTRLRNDVVETDWESAVSKEDWSGVIELVSNAKQVVSSVQDVAQKLADYAKFRGKDSDKTSTKTEDSNAESSTQISADRSNTEKTVEKEAEDLFVPGKVYYLKRNVDKGKKMKPIEYFTLLKRKPGEHCQRIVLSGNIISDHKCDSHYYALRDVLKGLPASSSDNL